MPRGPPDHGRPICILRSMRADGSEGRKGVSDGFRRRRMNGQQQSTSSSNSRSIGRIAVGRGEVLHRTAAGVRPVGLHETGCWQAPDAPDGASLSWWSQTDPSEDP